MSPRLAPRLSNKRESGPADGFGGEAGNVRQLELGLPRRAPLYDRAHFLVTESNRSAMLAASRFFETGETLLCISGPAQSGKTHLLHVLAEEHGGTVVGGRNLPPTITERAVIGVDDAHAADPEALLSLLAAARACGGRFLVAGAGDPSAWARGQRDLASRLGAAPCVTLSEPDEGLLVAVIGKHFADRQLRVRPEVARFAAPRLAKTFAAAAEFVNALDALALAERSELSVKLANRVLANLSEAPPAT